MLAAIGIFLAGVTALPARASGSPESVPLSMILDDGSAEDFIGCGQGGCRLVWVNTFALDTGQYPFQLEEIQAILPNFFEVGDTVRILVGDDLDGDGDPGNGNLFLVDYATVQFNDAATWNVFPVDPPLNFDGPGDVWIGLVNESGTQWNPAALDTDNPRGRSWVGQWDTDPLPDPPAWPPNDLWDPVENLCGNCAGNWVLRGFGTASGAASLPGDCNGDGMVSIGEVQRAINMFLGIEPPGCNADANGDGMVSIGEVQRVINAFLGIARRVVLD